ncbi:hypothetical protein Q8A67_001745 [Cirrhinus molitorella]|uniref:Ubiquitin-like domain-containing protein n=1 Tax=Cirrhinus molitorella TaxID=172907 RepID=A0AA88U5E4_9TELE|nr:hypothetical protein Q8A67_001745 [Cirrhinus molitorella]
MDTLYSFINPLVEWVTSVFWWNREPSESSNKNDIPVTRSSQTLVSEVQEGSRPAQTPVNSHSGYSDHLHIPPQCYSNYSSSFNDPDETAKVDRINIIVKCAGKTTEVDMYPLERISVLLKDACEQAGKKPEKMSLVYEGNCLDVNKTVSQYGLRGGTTLPGSCECGTGHVRVSHIKRTSQQELLSPKEFLRESLRQVWTVISFFRWNNKSLPANQNQEEPSESSNKNDIPVTRSSLTFVSEVQEGSRPAQTPVNSHSGYSDHPPQYYSNYSSSFAKQTDRINIIVKCAGKTIEVDMFPLERISALLKDACERAGKKPEKMSLVYEGNRLDVNKTVSQYGLRGGTTTELYSSRSSLSVRIGLF